ncbi:hypothetical protein CBM2586_A10638 [Cupriavidus phytorum]|uniref:Uncharacterized protein n=1 Tax=Cupriavidus taiwanensis TaxID=164546 RepID=A0A975ZW04_9BURK|nr:hypothetical protein CBM2586_A10638 [Cupriavidus taiwanensis]
MIPAFEGSNPSSPAITSYSVLTEHDISKSPASPVTPSSPSSKTGAPNEQRRLDGIYRQRQPQTRGGCRTAPRHSAGQGSGWPFLRR